MCLHWFCVCVSVLRSVSWCAISHILDVITTDNISSATNNKNRWSLWVSYGWLTSFHTQNTIRCVATAALHDTWCANVYACTTVDVAPVTSMLLTKIKTFEPEWIDLRFPKWNKWRKTCAWHAIRAIYTERAAPGDRFVFYSDSLTNKR